MAQKIHEWGHVVQTLDARLLAIEAFEFANLPQQQAILQERLGYLEADFAGWGRWATQGFDSSEEKLAHLRSKVHSIDENVRMIPSSLAEIRDQLNRVRESAHDANGLARESENTLQGVLGQMEAHAGIVQVARESGQRAMEVAERVSLELHVLREAGGGDVQDYIRRWKPLWGETSESCMTISAN
jgi:chromosome segregation ATPase